MKNKFDLLSLFIDKSGVDWSVICISETWLKDELVQYYDLDRYNLFASCRSTGEGGGTAIYVSNKYESKSRKDLECNEIETTFVEIELHSEEGISKNIVVGEIYKPPNYSDNDFLEYAEKLLDILGDERKCTLLAGDFVRRSYIFPHFFSFVLVFQTPSKLFRAADSSDFHAGHVVSNSHVRRRNLCVHGLSLGPGCG